MRLNPLGQGFFALHDVTASYPCRKNVELLLVLRQARVDAQYSSCQIRINGIFFVMQGICLYGCENLICRQPIIIQKIKKIFYLGHLNQDVVSSIVNQ